MSNFLMLYIDENTSFDPNVITQAVHSLNNTEISICESKYSGGTIKYELCNEKININIDKDWTFISIEHSGKAALDFAFRLNKLLNTNIYLTDSGYNFVCKLNEINSVQEIKDVMVQGIYMDK